MHDYLFSVEAVRFAFVAGIVASMIQYEKLHLTTGSIVVPGYIAVFFIHPLVLVATIANALASYWVVNHLVPRWFLLYGRTKFSVLAVVSIGIQIVMLKTSPNGAWLWESDVPLLVGAGYVVPALVAHDMARQGIKKSLKALAISGTAVAVPLLLALKLEIGANDLEPLVSYDALAISTTWVPFAVLLSAAVSWALLLNHGLRAGGFIGAAYIAMLSAHVLQVVFVFAVALVSYLIVSRLLMPWMILFGRRKFSAMLLIACVISWGAFRFGSGVIGIDTSAYLSIAGIALAPLFVSGLLANDMQRSGPTRVATGAILGAGCVLSTTWVVEAVVTGHAVEPRWAGIAVISGAAIFVNQIMEATERPRAFAARMISTTVADPFSPRLAPALATPARSPGPVRMTIPAPAPRPARLPSSRVRTADRHNVPAVGERMAPRTPIGGQNRGGRSSVASRRLVPAMTVSRHGL